MPAATSDIANGRTAAHRTRELDGLRGWAALSVVAFHMTWEVFGYRLPWLRSLPVGFVLNGNLAVALFFVLSGEALSSSFFGGSDPHAVAKQVVKRLPRLSVPILAAAFITVACQRNGWFFNIEAADIVGSEQWFGFWLRQPRSFDEIVPYAFFQVYVDHPTAQALIPFLWTMTYEMAGSIAVFAILFAWPKLRHPGAILGIAYAFSLVLDPSFYTSCFIAGVAFAEARSKSLFASLSDRRGALAGSTLIIVVLLLTASAMIVCGKAAATPLVAQALAFAVFLNRPVTRFLRRPVSASLGRLSFPLYLMQFPVLMSITSGLIVASSHDGTIGAPACLCIAAASVAASLLAAKAFAPVEDLTMQINRALVAICFGGKRSAARPALFEAKEAIGS